MRIKKKTNGRKVAQLLSIRNRNIKSVLRQIQHRDRPRHTYIYCRSTAVAKRFLEDAEKEGFVFGDGTAPTSKETSDIFALNDDFTISYTGIVAHMMFGCDRGNVQWIDYGKYVNGEKDFQGVGKRNGNREEYLTCGILKDKV